MTVSKDKICPITPADVARELACLRTDLADLERQIEGDIVKGGRTVNQQAWRETLRRRIAALEMLTDEGGRYAG